MTKEMISASNIMDRKDFRIQYRSIASLDNPSLANAVMGLRGLPLSQMSFEALKVHSEALNTSMFDWNGGRVFGIGVYIFRAFDPETGTVRPVYVGKTKKEFVGRFWGHFNTVYKPFWGWNAMLQYIAHHINNEELKIYPNAKGKPGKHPALERASKWIQDRGNLVLIDFDSSDQDQMKAMGKFEQHLARTLIAWDGKFMGQLQDFRSKIKDRKSE